MCVIRLELVLNGDDESGCYCGEQTGLITQQNQENVIIKVLKREGEKRTVIKVVSASALYLSTKRLSYSPVSRLCLL